MKKILLALAAALVLLPGCEKKPKYYPTYKDMAPPLRIMCWNIQNGMWSDQADNYDDFVEWVKSYDPDICIWCEAQPIYKDNSASYLSGISYNRDKYLKDMWDNVAPRYGHKYWKKSGHRDNYPQVITSKYPIEVGSQMKGPADTVIAHGAGWFKVTAPMKKKDGTVEDKEINVVTLHTYPFQYARGASEKFSDGTKKTANNCSEGHAQRLKEVQYICNHTIKRMTDYDNEWWVMAGDFNSVSPLDKANYGEGDMRLWVHEYILNNTPYVDVIRDKFPSETLTSTGSDTYRIDFMYLSPAMMKDVPYADIIKDYFTMMVDSGVDKFKHPSDHLPILVHVRL